MINDIHSHILIPLDKAVILVYGFPYVSHNAAGAAGAVVLDTILAQSGRRIITFKDQLQVNYTPGSWRKKTGPPPTFTTILVKCIMHMVDHVTALGVVQKAITCTWHIHHYTPNDPFCHNLCHSHNQLQCYIPYCSPGQGLHSHMIPV
jgi:hypothetical protein